MKIIKQHNFDSINNLSRCLVFIIIMFYAWYSFKSNFYIVLFIDERILIDDIYNIWLLDDVFNRFQNISNIYLKNILILITEVSYGGDLRYGRLWSNFYAIVLGPLSFFGERFLITSTRILNSLLFFSANYILSKNILKKEQIWIGILVLYSLPAVEYLHRIPKPESLSLLFVALGIGAFNQKKFYLAIFYLSISSFLKINTILLLSVFGIYMLFKTDIKKHVFIFKSSLLVGISLIIVNPILLIPPISFGKFTTPNFYKIYFNWLTSQSSNGDNVIFGLGTLKVWLNSISNLYLIPSEFSILVLIGLIIIFLFVSIQASRKRDVLAQLIVIISFLYLVFYFFYIERQFIHYLSLPLSLLALSLIKTLEMTVSRVKFIIYFALTILLLTGLFSNAARHIEDKNFNANYRFGYTDIYTPEDAKKLTDSVVFEIINIYKFNPSLSKNLVGWHPDLFVPRNGVTYNDNFYIREYWGSKDNVDEALTDYDIFVTYTDYKVDELIKKRKIQNIYIYFK